MKIFASNRNLLIIALIALVNALGYGIIIPILYSYSHKYGLTDFQNGLLFAIFSLGQFISTPVIGRLSDKYGRRPLLIISILGTAISFFMMAFAPNAIFLFIARALDGITAGNIPVASAVISDTTAPEDRAKGFGIIGASFGFGFIFGPVISAFTVGFSQSLPFIIAGTISVIALVLTAIYLPETNKHIGEVKHGKFFDFHKLFHALFDENVGSTFMITLFYWLAFGMFIYAFQPFSVVVLKLSPNQISIIYSIFGAVGLVAQLFILPKFIKNFGLKKGLRLALSVVIISFFGMFLSKSLTLFIIASVLLGLSNSTVNPLVQAILSQETDAKSQGSILGLNTSYMSIGQIFGPILGGALATIYTPSPFLAGSLTTLICFALSFHILKNSTRKESAF